jgi:hypothetical protein
MLDQGIRFRPPCCTFLLVKMRGPTYTIETALPRLYSLSLPAETLHAKFFFPEDGLENFLQFRMRVFVHTLMRAITHDFTHFTSLPAFPPPEHQKLRAWIEILMTHFVSSVAGFYRVADPRNAFTPAPSEPDAEAPYGENLRRRFILGQLFVPRSCRGFPNVQAIDLPLQFRRLHHPFALPGRP